MNVLLTRPDRAIIKLLVISEILKWFSIVSVCEQILSIFSFSFCSQLHKKEKQNIDKPVREVQTD